MFVQIISGLILSMHYSNEAAISFASIEYIMRSVNNGWLIRYTHSNGASVFLFILYAHIARGLYFRSFVGRGFVWCSGVLIFVLVVATAFFGYVLP